MLVTSWSSTLVVGSRWGRQRATERQDQQRPPPRISQHLAQPRRRLLHRQWWPGAARFELHDGSLRLFNLGRQSKDLLAMTKLLMVFDTFDTEQEGVDSFAGKSA